MLLISIFGTNFVPLYFINLQLMAQPVRGKGFLELPHRYYNPFKSDPSYICAFAIECRNAHYVEDSITTQQRKMF